MSNNNISNFIINNIGSIVALVIAILGLFKAIISKNKQQVFANIYGFVSDAEQLDNASGLEKFNFVYDNAYNKLPALLRFFISKDDIKRAIEYSLNKLQAYADIQSKSISTQATNNTVINNTNIQAPVDIAAQTAQNTSSTVANSSQSSQEQQNIISSMHDQTPPEVSAEVKAEQM